MEETISAAESPTETAEVTTPTEANPASPNTATSPDNKETKKKEKVRQRERLSNTMITSVATRGGLG